MTKSAQQQIKQHLEAIEEIQHSPKGGESNPYQQIRDAVRSVRELLEDEEHEAEQFTEEFMECCDLLSKFHHKFLRNKQKRESPNSKLIWTEQLVLIDKADVLTEKIEQLTSLFMAFYTHESIDWDIDMGDQWDCLEEYCLYSLPPKALQEWLAQDEAARSYFQENVAIMQDFLDSISEKTLYRALRAEYGVLLLRYAFTPELWRISMSHPATMSALIGRREDCIAVLSEEEWEPAYRNASGRGFMHYVMLHAKDVGDLDEILNVCPALRAQLNQQDYRGNTPFHHALNKRRLGGLLTLMRPVLGYKDLDLTLQNQQGYTVLMLAVYQQQPDIVRRLIDREGNGKRKLEVGCDLVNIFGQTALDIMLGQSKMGGDWKDLRDILDPQYKQRLENPNALRVIKRKAYHVKCCESLYRLQRIEARTMALLFEAQGYEQGAVIDSPSQLIEKIPALQQKSTAKDHAVSVDLVVEIMTGHYGVMFVDIDDKVIRAAIFDPSHYDSYMKEWADALIQAFPHHQCFIYLNTDDIQRDMKSCTIISMMNAFSGVQLRSEFKLFEHLEAHSALANDGIRYVKEGGFPAPIYRSVQSTSFFTAPEPLSVVLSEVKQGVTLQQQVQSEYFAFSASRQRDLNKFSKKVTQQQYATLQPFVISRSKEELEQVVERRQFRARVPAPSASHAEGVSETRSDSSIRQGAITSCI